MFPGVTALEACMGVRAACGGVADSRSILFQEQVDHMTIFSPNHGKHDNGSWPR